MWFFDQHVQGVRGDEVTPEELETFGVDWDGLRDAELLASWQANNATPEGAQSWVGRVGPPSDLSQVTVEPPVAEGIHPSLVTRLHAHVAALLARFDEPSRCARWQHSLAFMQAHYAGFNA